MSRRRIAFGIGANLLDRFVGLGIQLALVPLLALHWGLERYGGWAMLITIPGTLLLADLGFAAAASVRMTMQVAKGERDAARKTMRSASQVVFAACAVIIGTAALATNLLPDSFFLKVPETAPDQVRQAILFLAIYSSLVMLSGLIQALFRSNARFAHGSLIATLTILLENGLLITAVISGYGLDAGAFAMMLGRLCGVIIALTGAAMLRTGMLPGLTGGDSTVRRELLGPALAAMSIPMSFAFLLQGQVVALGLTAGAVMVPAFVAARTLSRIGLQAAQTIAVPIMPEFGSARAREDHRRVTRLFVLVLVSASAIAVPFAAVLAIAGPWIVLQWSHQQIHASPALMLAIALSALFGCIWNPLSNLMLALNKQAGFSLILMVLAVAGVATTYLLGPELGPLAPAMVLAAVDAIMLIVILGLARKHIGAHTDWIAAARELFGETVEQMRLLFIRSR